MVIDVLQVTPTTDIGALVTKTGGIVAIVGGAVLKQQRICNCPLTLFYVHPL